MNTTNQSATPNPADRDPFVGDQAMLSELEWRAFCYLADELSPDERQDFENLLEFDTAAQQALVAQMEFAEHLAAVIPAVASPPRPTHTRTLPASVAAAPANFRPDAYELPATKRGWQRIPYTWMSAAAVLLLIGASYFGWNWWQTQSEFQLADEWARQLSKDIAQTTSLDDVNHEGSEPLEWETAELEPDTDSGDESWIFAAAMALDDEDFDWLQGT